MIIKKKKNKNDRKRKIMEYMIEKYNPLEIEVFRQSKIVL